jgi:hypothetical protein
MINLFFLFKDASSSLVLFGPRYLDIMVSEGLEITQPALDPDLSTDIHHRITIRNKMSKVHRCFCLSNFQKKKPFCFFLKIFLFSKKHLFTFYVGEYMTIGRVWIVLMRAKDLLVQGMDQTFILMQLLYLEDTLKIIASHWDSIFLFMLVPKEDIVGLYVLDIWFIWSKIISCSWLILDPLSYELFHHTLSNI